MLAVTLSYRLIALILVIVIEDVVLFYILALRKKIAIKCPAVSHIILILFGIPLND